MFEESAVNKSPRRVTATPTGEFNIENVAGPTCGTPALPLPATVVTIYCAGLKKDGDTVGEGVAVMLEVRV